jgi:hypothetical protein
MSKGGKVIDEAKITEPKKNIKKETSVKKQESKK